MKIELNINTELEKKLISTDKKKIVLYLKSHPQHFNEALKLALSDKQPYSWRAASLLWSSIDENDIRIKKHVKKIIAALNFAGDGHQRELLNILLKLKMSDRSESQLFDKCMSIWEEINKKPSVRFTAFRFMINTVKKHPELLNEIVCVTQDRYLNTLSPAVKNSVLRIMKSLTQNGGTYKINFD